MDAVLTKHQLSDRVQIRPNHLLPTLNYHAQIKVLSLDCFDTLLWRKTITPIDMFYDLQHRPVFKALGISPANRADIEGQARQFNFIQFGHHEVRLSDIFRVGYPMLSQTQIDKLVEDEIAMEIETCYAFPPIVDLIREAHKKGIKVIIVSNTYFEKHQLQRLLQSCLPADAMAAIDEIFCSCEFNTSKENGLFKHVIGKLNILPQYFLHIGDNPSADLESAKRLGLNAYHLVQFDEKVHELLRMQCVSATLTDNKIRHTRSLSNPFRGMLACADSGDENPAHLIGYESLGPIMYSFGRFIFDEIEKIRRSAQSIKVLFLMRDGYLPALVCDELAGAPTGHRVRISRFAAIASSFRTRDDVMRYLCGNAEELSFHDIALQLLLPENIIQSIVKKAELSAMPAYTFSQCVLQNDILEMILKNSKAYFTRLKAYLNKTANIQPGDTVVFVDIGYVGRTQRVLTPVLCNELGVKEVKGIYLISLNVPNWQASRSGLIDPSMCDDRVSVTVCMGAGIVEEFCCSGDNSVMDYDESGNPIYSVSKVDEKQRVKVKLIQHECMRFIQDAKKYFQATGISLSRQNLFDTVVAELGRIAFFPTTNEIKYLQEFKHDANRGTEDSFYLYDTPLGELINLRQHGLTFKNQSPYGLRSAGFELSLATMAQSRFSFELNLDDMNLRREYLKVIIMRNNKSEERTLFATATHDGYFSLWFVLDNSITHAAIIFGINYEWIQLDSAQIIKKEAFINAEKKENSIEILPNFVFNQMTQRAEDIFECQATSSSAMVALPKVNTNSETIFRVIYRPIVRREPTC